MIDWRNKMNMYEYEQKRETLFAEWKEEQSKEPDESYAKYGAENVSKVSFIYDGIVCPETFESQEERILFISKESNYGGADKNYEFCASGNDFWLKNVYFRTKSETMFSQRLSLLSNAIINNDFITINKNHESLGKVSFINLNKRGGYSQSYWKTIREYTKTYGKYIAREIDIINPTLIVCCGKWLKYYLEKFVVAPNRYKIIEVYHPSYYVKSDADHLKKLKEELNKEQK